MCCLLPSKLAISEVKELRQNLFAKFHDFEAKVRRADAVVI
jgi:hypothetical protein